MRGRDYLKKGKARVRSVLKILKYVFTKATLRLDARNDYRLSAVQYFRVYRNEDTRSAEETLEKTNNRKM